VIHGDIYGIYENATIIEGTLHLTIYGRAGTNLEAFAIENGYRFSPID
jgi:hypothetical protein